MQIQLRRGSHLNGSKDLFEWRPPKAKTWYHVHRSNLFVYTGHEERRDVHFAFIRNFYNKLYKGETLRVRARYFQGIKVLVVEFSRPQLQINH